MNLELERAAIIVAKNLQVEKEVASKVIRWGWDEVRDTLESMEEISVEFPKFGQWIVNYKKLSGQANEIYDTLIYREHKLEEKQYALMTNKFLKLRQFMELIEKRLKDGYKVNYKKSPTYFGGNKKLPNNKG